MATMTVQPAAPARQGGGGFAYRPELDGLRAVAVLFVVEQHAGYFFGPGYLGVSVFFVLSGYLITSLLLAERARFGRVDYVAFYKRRALRLYPALLVGCAIAAVCAAAITIESTGRTLIGLLSAVTYTQDFLLASGHGNAWLGHTWSLAVEEQFYIVWPIVLMALARRAHLRRSIALVAFGLAVLAPLAAVVLTGPAVFYSPLGCAFQLVAGALLAVSRLPVPRGTWLLVAAIYVGMWVIGSDPSSSRALFFGQMQIFSVAAVLLLAWAVQYRPRALRHPAVVWIGRRSYGIYLYHFPIFAAIHAKPPAGRAANTLLGLAATLVVSAASYRWVEVPFLRRKPRPAGYAA